MFFEKLFVSSDSRNLFFLDCDSWDIQKGEQPKNGKAILNIIEKSSIILCVVMFYIDYNSCIVHNLLNLENSQLFWRHSLPYTYQMENEMTENYDIS